MVENGGDALLDAVDVQRVRGSAGALERQLAVHCPPRAVQHLIEAGGVVPIDGEAPGQGGVLHPLLALAGGALQGLHPALVGGLPHKELAQRGGGTWEVAPKEEGEIWLEVKCTGDGVIKSAELKETKGSSKPLQYVAEPDDEAAEEEFTYCFLLAKVEKLEEPLPEDGNLPSLVSVKQYALGAVYCGVAPDELGLKAGKGKRGKKKLPLLLRTQRNLPAEIVP